MEKREGGQPATGAQPRQVGPRRKMTEKKKNEHKGYSKPPFPQTELKLTGSVKKDRPKANNLAASIQKTGTSGG